MKQPRASGWLPVLCVFISACGGGGNANSGSIDGGGAEGSSGDGNTLGPDSEVSEAPTFSVHLTDMEIRRLSNGDPVPTDLSSITTGELTLE